VTPPIDPPDIAFVVRDRRRATIVVRRAALGDVPVIPSVSRRYTCRAGP